MLTTNILQNQPFNLNETECAEFLALAKRFDITLDGFLSGTVYSNTPYTEDQQEVIAKELQKIFEITFHDKAPSKNKKYTATAGAPGSGKSAFLEQLIEQDPELQNSVYVDPDRQSLRLMNWYKQLSREQGGEVAYETCRDASNYICNFLMVWAIYKEYSIVHGTTSTNDRVAKTILPQLKTHGYTIDIHVLFADAESRKGALLHRIQVQDFYQVTQADAKGKVAPVFDRLTDAFLEYGDNVTMYYNTGTFWLSINRQESIEHLRKFATLNRAISPSQITVEPNCLDILEKLTADIHIEIPAQDRQETLINMFRSWFTEKQKSYLPSFSRYTVLATTLAIVATGAAIYLGMNGDSNNTKPSPL